MLSHAPLSLVSALLLSASVVRSQGTVKIIPFSTLPACAATCDTLNAANDVCVPPAVPESDTATYTNCVCQSPTLTTIYQNSDSICLQWCPNQQDRDAIRNAYLQLCPNGAAAAPAPAPNPAGPPVVQNPAPSNMANLPASEFNGSDDTDNWLKNHYQWVIMIAVVAVAMIGGAFIGVCLKRRHRRKKNAAGANLGARDSIDVRPVSSISPLPQSSINGPGGAPQNMSQTSLPPGMMSMNSGIAPPRSRTLQSPRSRSRSSTVNSNAGPVVIGPHHTSTTDIPAIPPISPAYTQSEFPERTYPPSFSRPYSPANSLHRGVGGGHASPVHGATSPSPVSPVDGHGGFDGAGAQRIREMRSMDNGSRTGTPDSAGGKRLSKKISKRSSSSQNAF